jgi:hydroxymethylglutaryl-CoA lyase
VSPVRIRDIAPRLAFQAFPATTEQKVELVDRLTGAGVRAVEVSSFVNPRLVPGLADAAEVFARVKRPDGVSLECCVANERGLRQAIDAGAHAAWFLLAADEQFSRLNTGRSIDESLAELERMRTVADGSGITLGTYLIATFGGPVGTPRGPDDVHPVAERLLSLGIRDWILADSCGYAAPPQVAEMLDWATRLTSLEQLHLQVHDSRGMGLANVAEAARVGMRNIDTALAGSGAHPASPGALVGGTCTEDAVQMLERMDIDTGINLPALIDAANWLDGVLGGAGLGFVRRSGAVPRSSGDIARQAQGGRFDWAATPSAGEI